MTGEIKEEFCAACAVGLASLANSGVSSYSNSKNNDEQENTEESRNRKKYMFWITVFLTVLSIFLLIYFLFIRKCDECVD